MIQYLFEKFEHIKKQRNLYCTSIKADANPNATFFLYDFICENTHGKGPNGAGKGPNGADKGPNGADKGPNGADKGPNGAGKGPADK